MDFPQRRRRRPGPALPLHLPLVPKQYLRTGADCAPRDIVPVLAESAVAFSFCPVAVRRTAFRLRIFEEDGTAGAHLGTALEHGIGPRAFSLPNLTVPATLGGKRDHTMGASGSLGRSENQGGLCPGTTNLSIINLSILTKSFHTCGCSDPAPEALGCSTVREPQPLGGSSGASDSKMESFRTKLDGFRQKTEHQDCAEKHDFLRGLLAAPQALDEALWPSPRRLDKETEEVERTL